jgi:ABC-type multidrug transport system fused ATPase/permease subunit
VNPVLVLLRLIRFSPRYFVLCVVFAIFEMCLPLFLGLASRAFFDALSGEPAGLNVWSAITLLVTAQVAEILVGPVLGNPWNALQQKSRVLLERNLMAGVLRGYGRHGLRESVGDTISRFRDEPDSMADGLDAVCDLIARTLFAAIALAVMWQVNPLMTIVLCVPLGLSAWWTEALGTRTMAYRAAAHAATSRLTGFLGELLGAHLAITVAGASADAVGRLNELGESRRRMAVRDSVFDVLLDSLSINIGHVGAGLVLLLGAHAIAEGSFSVGDFALFVVYLDQLVWYPAEIGRLISDLKRTDISFGRMHAVVPSEPPSALVASIPPVEVAPPLRERLERLEVCGLSYAHEHGGAGVEDVSFVVERGSFTVITGRIGSGKSTLLQVLLGLLPRQRGEIRWNGRLVDDPSSFFVPPRSAYTPQVPRLFSESLRDNVWLGRPMDTGALERAVHAAVLEPDVRALEGGLDTLVGPRGVKLSGGQIQRVAAARMFVTGAELLVLDDLSSALDAETEAELWARLFARGRDVTCLVVSHRPAALRRADQILHFNGGRLVTASGDVHRPLVPAASAGEPDGRVDVRQWLER